jgi:hypothetical protein
MLPVRLTAGLLIAGLLVAGLLAAATSSSAKAPCAAPSGDRLAPVLTAPCVGARLKAGHNLTWRVTDTNRNARQTLGRPFLNLTRTRPRRGVLPEDQSGHGIYTRMTPVAGHPGHFSYRAKPYAFAGYWLVTKGTWYVQVQQIDATARHGRRDSPVERITIR